MTRRELGKLAAVGGAAILPAMLRAAAQSKYGGPLESFENKLTRPRLTR